MSHELRLSFLFPSPPEEQFRYQNRTTENLVIYRVICGKRTPHSIRHSSQHSTSGNDNPIKLVNEILKILEHFDS